MNCHKLCKDQVAFECKKNTKVSGAIDSPTLSSTPVTIGTSEGWFDDEQWPLLPATQSQFILDTVPQMHSYAYIVNNMNIPVTSGVTKSLT